MSNWAPVRWLADLLQPVLAGIDGFVHDWGVAVILLTLLVRICLFPMSVRNARLMWKNRLFTKAYRDVQAKFKHDPEQLKQATFDLTKEHRFNPFSMLGTAVLQMPIFAAVYAVFYHFGDDITSVIVPWVSALNHGDSTHILPMLVAGLTALGALVPMLTPEAAEGAAQASKLLPMLILFPMMLFFLWSAPAAIALYMGTSSVWGMAERRFLRSGFAVDTFKLRPTPAVTLAAEGDGLTEDERNRA